MFDDAIIHNSISMNKLPPLSTTSVCSKNDKEVQKFWKSLIKSQLHSVYAALCNAINLPSKNKVLCVDRHSPLDYDTLKNLTQHQHQTSKSFNEQQYVIKVFIKQIKNTKMLTDISE